MTLAEFYITTEGMFRQMGRTTALVRAAQSIDGLFIVQNDTMKREMLKKYPDLNVEAMSSTKVYGNNRPIILDHYALHTLLVDATRELVKLRSDLQASRFQIKNLEEMIEDLNGE